MRQIKHKQILPCSAAVAILAFNAAPAQACSDLPNICAQQAQHNQNMNDIAATPTQDGGYDDGGPPRSSAPRFDPMQALLSKAKSVSTVALQQTGELAERLKDPKFKQAYDRYQKGGWDYFQDQTNARPGEYCAAFYWKGSGMVRLSGPGGDYKGALLTFWSDKIPTPNEVRKIKVTLRQSAGGVPQIVDALNYKLPGDAFGAIALTLPSIENLIDNILDVQNIELSMNGDSVANIDWTGGFAARERLRQCAARRSKG